jgi:hypothetical protein
MTLYAMVAGEHSPRPIAIQMTREVADKLGRDLVSAAIEIQARET